ncbi:hypothetical protein [Bosea caraganae]|uniref:hypothetical protein n=1 Tax=Bosea caraganae TaxID=2763117 RepID=UPI0011C04EC0|nr:hypothetical protein [Bosea caraganae]
MPKTPPDEVATTPVVTGWEWLDALTGEIDPDFEAALEEEVPPQERPELEQYFLLAPPTPASR